MLNIGFLGCTKVELKDLTVCIVVNGEKFPKFHRDLDLDPTMPNIELVQHIFIYNNVFKFYVSRLVTLKISCKHTHTHTHTHARTHARTHTHTHTHIHTHKHARAHTHTHGCTHRL